MGAPPPPTPPADARRPPRQATASSTALLSAQHERLILELLPFKDAAKFHEWLASGWVRGSWLEFSRDFMAASPGSAASEPDKTQTAKAARDAINSRLPAFLVYHPDKTGWSADSHHVRFIVTVVQDNMLKGLWSESEWKKKGTDIAKAVFEVLCFLKSFYSLADQQPPSYSR